MKLAHVTMFFFPALGGQETYIQSLNQLLSEENITISVVQPSRPAKHIKPEFVHYVPRLRHLHRYVTGIDWFWFNLMLFFKKKFLKSQDVIISHYPFHYPALKNNHNVIVVSHGVDWCEPPRLLLDKFKKYAAQMVLKSDVRIVANDTDFIRALGLKAEAGTGFFEKFDKNIWFIPNCVDPAKFYCTGETREKIIFLPRNITKSRGIHLAIEAFNLFAKIKTDFILLIAGAPLTGKYYTYCANLVKQFALEDKIKFIGSVSNSVISNYYNKSMITLVPSLGYEGTSISALESMACKTPVVSTITGGLADLPTYKVGRTANAVSDGMFQVLTNWESESERQFRETTKVFNTDNWKKAWLKIVAG
jgi:glycosyltransferase involved in cell wall biosynthesis